MTLFLAILALGLLIIGHEGGHYLVARAFGMRVERFSIGFGPALVKWRRGETQFQLSVFPLGGFVQIVGMNPHEEFDQDDPRSYPNRPAWQRFLTIFAGPASNYVAAIVLIFAVFMGSGIETGRAEVASVIAGEPAAGRLQAGDVIVAVNGRAVTDEQFKGEIQKAQGVPTVIRVLRGGQIVDVTVTPVLKKAADAGERDEFRIGIGLAHERAHVGVAAGAYHALRYPWVKSKEILVGLYKVIRREVPGDVTGPIGITMAIREQVELGWVRAFEVLALLNVYLGLFNLLPLPALDGGRLVFLGYELAFRRRPNPKVEAGVHMVGFVMLFVLMILVMFKDIKRLFT